MRGIWRLYLRDLDLWFLVKPTGRHGHCGELIPLEAPDSATLCQAGQGGTILQQMQFPSHRRAASAPPPPPAASDGPKQGASSTRNRFGGCLPWGRCDPDGAAVPLPYQVLHTRSRGECDVLWQTSPVSIPADLVKWSSGSALTLCIMSRTVHRRLCASAAVARCGTCSDCHCLRVSADTPLTALRGARHAPRSGPWNDMVCVYVRECGPEAPGVTPTRVPKCVYGNFTRRSRTG